MTCLLLEAFAFEVLGLDFRYLKSILGAMEVQISRIYSRVVVLSQ